MSSYHSMSHDSLVRACLAKDERIRILEEQVAVCVNESDDVTCDADGCYRDDWPDPGRTAWLLGLLGLLPREKGDHER